MVSVPFAVGSFRRWDREYTSRMPDAKHPQIFKFGTARRGSMYVTDRTREWFPASLKSRLGGLGDENADMLATFSKVLPLFTPVAAFIRGRSLALRDVHDAIQKAHMAQGADQVEAFGIVEKSAPTIHVLFTTSLEIDRDLHWAIDYVKEAIPRIKAGQPTEQDKWAFGEIRKTLSSISEGMTPDDRKSFGLGAPIAAPIIWGIVILAGALIVGGAAVIATNSMAKALGGDPASQATALSAAVAEIQRSPLSAVDKEARVKALIDNFNRKFDPNPGGLVKTLGWGLLIVVGAWAAYKVLVTSGFGKSFGSGLGSRLSGGHGSTKDVTPFGGGATTRKFKSHRKSGRFKSKRKLAALKAP